MSDNGKHSYRGPEITRRKYMQGTAATGAGLAGLGTASAHPPDDPDIPGSEEFLEKVEAGDPVLGMSASFASMDPATVVGNHPAVDWVWVDTEHGAYDLFHVRQIVEVIPDDTAAIVRIPGHHPREVDRVLDAGADGVIIPFLPRVDGLDVVEEVEAFVNQAYYPPDGNRGAAGGHAATKFGLHADEYLDTINDQVFVIVQVETREMIENIDRIAKIDGLDSLLIGPFDLSHQLGDPVNYENPEFIAAVEATLEASLRHDVAPGYWVGGEAGDEEEFIDEGWQVLSLGSDAGLLAAGIENRFPNSD